jgi:hypothetical protein
MWRRGWYNLYFLMVLICVVGWMLDVAVVVWLLLLLVVVCVCDNSLVVLETSCPWCPLFPGNPLFGVRNPCRETGSKICAVAASVPGPGLACHCHGPGRDILDGERPCQPGAGWLCCAPAADCGCPIRSLTVKALSGFGWTAEGPWAFSGTQPFADGALRIRHTSRTADIALGDFWMGP